MTAGEPRVAPDTIQAAARWLVRLHGGELDAGGQRELQQWRTAHPDHERAWLAAESLAGTLQRIPPGLARPALARARDAQRRAAIKGITLALVLPATGWLGWRQWGGPLTADYRTATGERRDIRLPDGSLLALNTASAADLAFDADRRRVILQAGEILIETRPDSVTPARPFVVETRQGTVRALGTRFLVRADNDRCHVTVMTDAVEISLHDSASTVRLAAGETASFDRAAASPASPAPAGSDAWQQGSLVADRQPLGDFLDALARHRPGVLRCDPAVAALRISGVFQLDDTDRILAALEETLPVRVSRHTRYWVSVHALPPA